MLDGKTQKVKFRQLSQPYRAAEILYIVKISSQIAINSLIVQDQVQSHKIKNTF
jgi:hypothetical protein